MSMTYYDGVLLPEFPSDIASRYIYHVIHAYISYGEKIYLASFSNVPFVIDVHESFTVSETAIVITFAYYDEFGDWVNETGASEFTPNSGISLPMDEIVWTDHDIISLITNEVIAPKSPDPGDLNANEKKYLGMTGTERLIANACGLIDAILPSGGLTGQILTIGEDGNLIWKNYAGNTSLSVVEEVEV